MLINGKINQDKISNRRVTRNKFFGEEVISLERDEFYRVLVENGYFPIEKWKFDRRAWSNGKNVMYVPMFFKDFFLFKKHGENDIYYIFDDIYELKV